MNNKLKKKSPARWWQVAIAALGYMSQKKQERRARREMKGAQAEYEKRLKKYEELEFKPIDPEIANQENIFEDMEVDTTAFEMQRKAFAQQQANILQGLKGVAGSSGAAGLAQALSNQAEMSSERMAVGIGQMMARNRELRLQEESRINQAMTNIELANAEGARQFELDQLATLLGVEGQKVAGARQGLASAQAATGQYMSAVGSMAGSYFGAGGTLKGLGIDTTGSDRKLKKNISLIGKSPSGLNIYSFEYKDTSYGEGLFQGVMSDEVPQEAVSSVNGYDHVNYGMLDVEFKQI